MYPPTSPYVSLLEPYNPCVSLCIPVYPNALAFPPYFLFTPPYFLFISQNKAEKGDFTGIS